jgi:hypothetical protein
MGPKTKGLRLVSHATVSYGALHWSAQRGAVGVVKALLAAGVDTVATDANGLSALGMAHDSKVLTLRAEAADAIVGLLIGERVVV